MNKNDIAAVLFNNSDLGGRSANLARQCIQLDVPYAKGEEDPITAVIVNAVNQAEDLDELESNFNYAINQLEIAKRNALSVK